jgi:hypothetical protein
VTRIAGMAATAAFVGAIASLTAREFTRVSDLETTSDRSRIGALTTTVACRECGATDTGWLHRGWYLDPADARGDLCPEHEVLRQRADLLWAGRYGRS